MEDKTKEILKRFSQSRPQIDAVYTAQKFVYFYVDHYTWDTNFQLELTKLKSLLGLELNLMGTSISPDKAEQRGLLEERIYEKEKNQ